MKQPCQPLKIRENEVLKYFPESTDPKVIDGSFVYTDSSTKETVVSDPIIVKRAYVPIRKQHNISLLLDIYGEKAFEIIALHHPEIKAARRIQEYKELYGVENASLFQNITTVFGYQVAGISQTEIQYDLFYPRINGQSYCNLSVADECFEVHQRRMCNFAQVLETTHCTLTAHKDIALRNLVVPEENTSDIVLIDFGAATLDDDQGILNDLFNYITLVEDIATRVFTKQRDDRAFTVAVRSHNVRREVERAYKSGVLLPPTEIAHKIFKYN
jgi:hypothetical protein